MRWHSDNLLLMIYYNYIHQYFKLARQHKIFSTFSRALRAIYRVKMSLHTLSGTLTATQCMCMLHITVSQQHSACYMVTYCIAATQCMPGKSSTLTNNEFRAQALNNHAFPIDSPALKPIQGASTQISPHE